MFEFLRARRNHQRPPGRGRHVDLRGTDLDPWESTNPGSTVRVYVSTNVSDGVQLAFEFRSDALSNGSWAA
ncbi:hypothetical protein [Streptomyces liangshanensis]|uniref:hypothetical protein n=1 Tax=Streptomyces liangshanensis TaxID=2717324 RepID=UPI0036DA38F7